MEPEGNDKRLREKLPPSGSLFVGNIPWTAVDKDLHKLFFSYGPIERVSLCMLFGFYYYSKLCL